MTTGELARSPTCFLLSDHSDKIGAECDVHRVSAVDGSRPDVILSGCYDGMLRIWNGKPHHPSGVQGNHVVTRWNPACIFHSVQTVKLGVLCFRGRSSGQQHCNPQGACQCISQPATAPRPIVTFSREAGPRNPPSTGVTHSSRNHDPRLTFRCIQ